MLRSKAMLMFFIVLHEKDHFHCQEACFGTFDGVHVYLSQCSKSRDREGNQDAVLMVKDIHSWEMTLLLLCTAYILTGLKQQNFLGGKEV